MAQSPPPALADILTPEERAFRDTHPRLNVVYVPAPPFAMDRGGGHTGFTVELLEKAARLVGVELGLRASTLSQALAALDSGEADLMLNLPHTPERRARYLLGERAVRYDARIYARADRPDITDLASLSGSRVAVWPGNVFRESLLRRVPGMWLVDARDYQDALDAVSDGRADATISASQIGRWYLAERGITNVAERGPSGLHDRPWAVASLFAARADRPQLAGLINKAVDAVEAGELQRLHWRWFGTSDLVATLRAQVRLTDAERAFLADHPDVLLGVRSNWRPLVIEHADGTIGGIDADTVTLMNQVLGTRIRLRSGAWEDLVQSATRRDIDGLSASAAYEERAKDFLPTDPYTTVARVVLTRSGNPLKIRSLADLMGKRIGLLGGSLADPKHVSGLAGIIPVPLEAESELLNALREGQVDAVLAGESVLHELRERDSSSIQQVLTLDAGTDLVFWIRKDWPLLASAMNKVLSALPEAERLAIKRRYLPADPGAISQAGHVQISAPERAWLNAKANRLTYCFHPAWPPFDYLEDGQHRGLFRDFLGLFAQKLGAELVPLPARDWIQAQRFARERRCDLISGAIRTSEREPYLDFTAPYAQLTLVLVGRDQAPFVGGIAELAGKSLGVPAGSAITTALRARFPDLTLVEIGNVAEFGAAIANGRVYAAVTGLENAADLVENGLGRFRIIGKLDGAAAISVAVRNDAPELLALMEKAVGATTAAERNQIMGRRTTFNIEEKLDLTRLWQVLGILGVIALLLGYRHYELSRLNRRLVAAKEAAEAANRSKSDFLAVMSHELRTPLTAVLGLAELGARGGDPARLMGYLEDIERSGRSLLAVVNEILDFSRLEERGESLREAPFKLTDLIGRVVLVAGPLAAEKGLDLQIKLAPGLDGQWLGDAQKIERILVNLAGNAVKFTERGGVEVRVRDLGAEESATGPGTWLSFEVKDTGIGIDPQHIPMLFNPFQQSDSSLARRQGGTGLGLAIVDRLVKIMGGRVEVESRPGEGSLFRVLIALAPLGEGAHPRGAEEASRQEGWSELPLLAGPAADQARPRWVRPPRVLVVEDNGVNRLIVSELLGRLGLQSDAVADGSAALRRLESDPRGFDLVLMDVQMPDMDGYETTRRLRGDPRFSKLPVVAMTAHVLEEDRQRCRGAGMDDHIAKPFDLESFAQTLGRCLGLDLHWEGGLPMAGPSRDPGGGDPGLGRPVTAGESHWNDREAGLEWVGGDPVIFDKTLDEFQRAYGAKLALLEVGDLAQQAEALRTIAHMLRGTAPLLGANRLAALAAAVEDAFNKGGRPSSQAAAELRSGLAAALEEARGLVSGASGRGKPGPRGLEEDGQVAVVSRPERILLIEDDLGSANLLTELLGDDFDVSSARSGAEGLRMARASPAPDLILLDVVMDDMDGYAVCRELKGDPVTRDIPVIFVTGRVDVEDERLGLELGAVDYIHKPYRRRVVQARIRNHLAVKRQGDNLLQLSLVDSLTGLPNRRRMDTYLADVWDQAVRNGDFLGLVMIDVDYFKAYNDRYGHAAGDDCLRRVAAALQGVCRTGPGLLGRYGGEEFLWAIPGADLGGARAAAALAQDAVRALAIPHGGAPNAPLLTLSMGVWACRPQPGARLFDCIDEADRRLYRAKAEGRDRIVP